MRVRDRLDFSQEERTAKTEILAHVTGAETQPYRAAKISLKVNLQGNRLQLVAKAGNGNAEGSRVNSATRSRPSGSERRSWLKYLLATSIGASLVSILYPAIRYLIPPKQPESQSDQVTVTTVDKLPANSGQVFRFGSEPAILIRTPAGKLEAFSAVCTHLQCTVHYRPARHDIYCPCHGGVYNLEGVPTGGPPPRPLTKYRAEVRDDEIIVLRG